MTFRVLSRDPGQKPGYALLDGSGAVLWAGHVAPRDGHVALVELDLAVTEGQWWFGDSEKDPNRLFKLAFDAGWSLRAIPARRYMLLPPKVWRGNTAAEKAQIQNRIARGLRPEERALFKDIPKARHGDALDAIGIGRGALANLQSSQYDWPGKGYGN